MRPLSADGSLWGVAGGLNAGTMLDYAGCITEEGL